MTITSDAGLRDLLLKARTIAVVGVSARRSKPAFGVARYLLSAGYEVIPVNPHVDEWEGLKAYPTVAEIGRPVDIVDVFRRPEFVLETVEDAIAADAGAIWTQLGVVSDVATERAVDAGMPIVVNHCIAIEHGRLVGQQRGPR